MVSEHALQQVWGGGIPACLAGFQAHSQGGSLRGSGQGRSPGPHPRGKLRGIWLGGSPGPHLGGSAPGGVCSWGGVWSWEVCSWGVPGPSGVCSRGVPGSWGGLCGEPSGTATAVGGTHPTGMHSCLKCYLVHCMAAYFCYYLGFRIDISHIYRMTYPKKQSQFERVLSKLSMYIITNTNQTLGLSFMRDYVFWNGFSLYDR